MTIRIVIDNEDRDGIGDDPRVWTANAYLIADANLSLITSDGPGLGITPAEALANMRPDIDFTKED